MFKFEGFGKNRSAEKETRAVISVLRGITKNQVTDSRLAHSETIKEFFKTYRTYYPHFDIKTTHQLKEATHLLTNLFEGGIITVDINSKKGDPFSCTTRDLGRIIFLDRETRQKQNDGVLVDRLRHTHPLLGQIGVGHTHLDKLSEQLKNIDNVLSEEEGIDVSKLTPPEHIKHVAKHLIREISGAEGMHFEATSEERRRENATAVNT